MRYFSIECEAPGGGFGPQARVKYDVENTYVQEVEYLDLLFDVWLGGELIQHVECFCVTGSLWNHLVEGGIRGVSVRGMAATAGEHFHESHSGRSIPTFMELVLPRTLRAAWKNGWLLDGKSIPNSDMFTGLGLPLFAGERTVELLSAHRTAGLEITEVAGILE